MACKALHCLYFSPPYSCFSYCLLFLFYSVPAIPALFKLPMVGTLHLISFEHTFRSSLSADICRIHYLTCFKSLLKSCLHSERPFLTSYLTISCMYRIPVNFCIFVHLLYYSFWFLSVFHHYDLSFLTLFFIDESMTLSD